VDYLVCLLPHAVMLDVLSAVGLTVLEKTSSMTACGRRQTR